MPATTFEQHVVGSPYYTDNDLSAQHTNWDYSAFFINTDGDMGLSVSVKDPSYSRSRYLLLILYEGKTTTVKKALYMKFNPTAAYYEQYKERDYTRFTGHAETFETDGTKISARACFDGVWKTPPASASTRCDIEAVDVYGWICVNCGWCCTLDWYHVVFDCGNNIQCERCAMRDFALSDNIRPDEDSDIGGGGGGVNPTVPGDGGNSSPVNCTDSALQNTATDIIAKINNFKLTEIFKNPAKHVINITQGSGSELRHNRTTQHCEISICERHVTKSSPRGLALVLLHEFCHAFLFAANVQYHEERHHDYMITSNVFVEFIQALYPGCSSSEVNLLKYSGNTGDDEFLKLPRGDRRKIKKYLQNQGIPLD